MNSSVVVHMYPQPELVVDSNELTSIEGGQELSRLQAKIHELEFQLNCQKYSRDKLVNHQRTWQYDFETETLY